MKNLKLLILLPFVITTFSVAFLEIYFFYGLPKLRRQCSLDGYVYVEKKNISNESIKSDIITPLTTRLSETTYSWGKGDCFMYYTSATVFGETEDATMHHSHVIFSLNRNKSVASYGIENGSITNEANKENFDTKYKEIFGKD